MQIEFRLGLLTGLSRSDDGEQDEGSSFHELALVSSVEGKGVSDRITRDLT